MAKFKVTLTRLVEEECSIYMDAEGEDEIYGLSDKALALVDEDVSELVWMRSATQPHPVQVEEVELASELDKHKE